MSLLLRRPLAGASAFKQASSTFKQAASASRPIRGLHQLSTPLKSSATKTSGSSSLLRYAQTAFRRNYASQTPALPTASGSLLQRLLYGGAIFGGTVLAVNMVFNRETREDGGMPPFERAYLNDTFMHTGLGLGMIAVGARALHTSGWSVRLMATNPWLVIGGGLVASIGSMYGCMATDPSNYVQKYALWGAFNLTQSALLAPMLFFQPALLARAALYTTAMMGSLAFVGATAKTDKYLYIGGPLLAGVGIVAVSGLAPLVLPATATRTLMVTENLWLWGGLAVFGGFTLYDVQRILQHARLAERGIIQRDAVKESISLELDFINIFIRMVQILGMQGGRRK